MFERNALAQDKWVQKHKQKDGDREKKGRSKDADLIEDALGNEDGDGEERKEEKEKGAGVRKVRLGTFEDSGNCKGCVVSESLIWSH